MPTILKFNSLVTPIWISCLLFGNLALGQITVAPGEILKTAEGKQRPITQEQAELNTNWANLWHWVNDPNHKEYKKALLPLAQGLTYEDEVTKELKLKRPLLSVRDVSQLKAETEDKKSHFLSVKDLQSEAFRTVFAEAEKLFCAKYQGKEDKDKDKDKDKDNYCKAEANKHQEWKTRTNAYLKGRLTDSEEIRNEKDFIRHANHYLVLHNCVGCAPENSAVSDSAFIEALEKKVFAIGETFKPATDEHKKLMVGKSERFADRIAQKTGKALGNSAPLSIVVPPPVVVIPAPASTQPVNGKDKKDNKDKEIREKALKLCGFVKNERSYIERLQLLLDHPLSQQDPRSFSQALNDKDSPFNKKEKKALQEMMTTLRPLVLQARVSLEGMTQSYVSCESLDSLTNSELESQFPKMEQSLAAHLVPDQVGLLYDAYYSALKKLPPGILFPKKQAKKGGKEHKKNEFLAKYNQAFADKLALSPLQAHHQATSPTGVSGRAIVDISALVNEPTYHFPKYSESLFDLLPGKERKALAELWTHHLTAKRSPENSPIPLSEDYAALVSPLELRNFSTAEVVRVTKNPMGQLGLKFKIEGEKLNEGPPKTSPLSVAESDIELQELEKELASLDLPSTFREKLMARKRQIVASLSKYFPSRGGQKSAGSTEVLFDAQEALVDLPLPPPSLRKTPKIEVNPASATPQKLSGEHSHGQLLDELHDVLGIQKQKKVPVLNPALPASIKLGEGFNKERGFAEQIQWLDEVLKVTDLLTTSFGQNPDKELKVQTLDQFKLHLEKTKQALRNKKKIGKEGLDAWKFNVNTLNRLLRGQRLLENLDPKNERLKYVLNKDNVLDAIKTLNELGTLTK